MNTVGSDRRLNYYRMLPADVIAELRSHKMGLTNAEAARRYDQLGPNLLYQVRHHSALETFFSQFKNIMVIVFLISTVGAVYLQASQTAFLLILISLVIMILGFNKDQKAETLFEKLDDLISPRAKVIRNGDTKTIDSAKLVLGDIVVIEEGDLVPADLRILDEVELSTNDYALTGEYGPCRKFAHALSVAVPLPNRHNLVFMGTTVASGKAHGIVIGAGMHTELGRVASLCQIMPGNTSSWQAEMKQLTVRLFQGSLVLAAILAVVAWQANLGLKTALLFAIAFGVAIFPSGLFAELFFSLTQTARSLVKSRVSVNQLAALETLGATNIILTDKSSLLSNKVMTVNQLLIGRTPYRTSGTGYEPSGFILNDQQKPLTNQALEAMTLFFTTGVLACNAKVSQPDAQHQDWYVIGEPVEGAILTVARKAGLNTERLPLTYPELREFPYDASRQLMSSVRRSGDQVMVFVRGAPEVVLEHSTKLWDHGHVRRLTTADQSYFSHYQETEEQNGLDNIALAYRILPVSTNLEKLDFSEAEQNLIFLGMISVNDPLGEAVPAAISTAQRAYIQVSVITSDYPASAKALAVKAHLAAHQNQVKVVTADELAALSDSQIMQLIDGGGVIFSRATAEDKLRIVEIARASGQIVTVTGESLIDLPALKQADIGVALAKTSTDATNDAAEITLLDNHISALVSAIEQGRITFNNLKKTIGCALTDNCSLFFAVLFSLVGQVMFHVPMAITAIQVLAMNALIQVFPLSALSWDKPLGNLMHNHPSRYKDHVINNAAVREFILFGFLSAVLAYINFLLFFTRRGLSPAYIDSSSSLYAQAVTLAFVTIVLCQFMNLLLVRADKHNSLFTKFLWSNKKLLIAFGISLFCLLNILYNPVIQSFFHTGSLNLADWLTAIGAATIYLGIRLFQRHTRKHTRLAVIKLHREVHGKTSTARI